VPHAGQAARAHAHGRAGGAERAAYALGRMWAPGWSGRRWAKRVRLHDRLAESRSTQTPRLPPMAATRRCGRLAERSSVLPQRLDERLRILDRREARRVRLGPVAPRALAVVVHRGQLQGRRRASQARAAARPDGGGAVPYAASNPTRLLDRTRRSASPAPRHVLPPTAAAATRRCAAGAAPPTSAGAAATGRSRWRQRVTPCPLARSARPRGRRRPKSHIAMLWRRRQSMPDRARR
jgi:hypothetical protein